MSSLTVLITTKDRAPLLDRALKSVYAQTIVPKVLVVDDGSSDETSALVREQHPGAHLVRNEASLGIIAARNQGFDRVDSDLVLTLDDDAVLVDPRTIELAIPVFGDPRVGVLALPIVDFIDGEAHPRPQPDGVDDDAVCLPTFSGGACIIRRNDFLSTGGYGGWDRQGEEADLSVRLLERGVTIVAGHEDTRIWHFPEKTASDRAHQIESAARNRLLSAAQRSPGRIVLLELCAIALRYGLLGIRLGFAGAVWRGLAGAPKAFWSMGLSREPVSWHTYRLHRRLVRSGGLPLSLVGEQLPG